MNATLSQKRITDSSVKSDRYLSLSLFGIYFSSLVFAAIAPDIISILVFLGLFFVWAVIFCKNKINNMALFAIIPLIISSFQNVFLGIMSPVLSSLEIQLFLSFGLIYSIALFGILFFKNKIIPYYVAPIIFSLFILIFYGFAISFLNGMHIGSFVSSMRNLIAPFMYFLIGYYAYKNVDKERFVKYFTIILLIVFIFGLYELLLDPLIWDKLNISNLWAKKGIPMYGNLLPANFYSSEIIFGSQVRRMSSTYADPVNLGTFLGLAFIIFMFEKKYIFALFSVIAIVLTVSKGALLAILIFCIFRFYSRKNLVPFFIMCILGVSFGVLFIIYSINNSTLSIVAHIGGFFKSFNILIQFPFGLGIGNVGTLSSLFNSESLNYGIQESGLGMVFGQLGFVGFLCYGVLFICILTKAKFLSLNKKRLLIIILFSIFSNIIFNEVALSPNSCGSYFIILGFLVKNSQIVNNPYKQESLRNYRL